MLSPLVGLSALLLFRATEAASGVTTRYWDCCKPSCAWTGKASVSSPVGTCDINDNAQTPSDMLKSSCDGGDAYYCSNQGPWAVDDNLSYGFAAAKLSGKQETDWCCGCYKLTFTSTAVSGKQMVVQITNTGGDLGDNHFDIAMPGGGVGIFNGCSKQWGGVDLGNQYGGFTQRSQCDNLPSKWQDSCHWRFDWFENADNPTVDWEEVTCPQELVAKTGCSRQ
ncbi:Glycoside hydrolase family 45 [Botryosphaeria dothidea]|uniref:Cellulase n=1 Tax=Botryosphaeria dothidea TaxID=55169 RepID=A0A8H4IKD4_9PEZI|nr:Glycoside hydrolase family 45 [Botryosphaeria dothidea]KAF4305736.1 Glycoside hydrolase family 45 [Botryosphaeria dothidea]